MSFCCGQSHDFRTLEIDQDHNHGSGDDPYPVGEEGFVPAQFRVVKHRQSYRLIAEHAKQDQDSTNGKETYGRYLQNGKDGFDVTKPGDVIYVDHSDQRQCNDRIDHDAAGKGNKGSHDNTAGHCFRGHISYPVDPIGPASTTGKTLADELLAIGDEGAPSGNVHQKFSERLHDGVDDHAADEVGNDDCRPDFRYSIAGAQEEC